MESTIIFFQIDPPFIPRFSNIVQCCYSSLIYCSHETKHWYIQDSQMIPPCSIPYPAPIAVLQIFQDIPTPYPSSSKNTICYLIPVPYPKPIADQIPHSNLYTCIT